MKTRLSAVCGAALFAAGASAPSFVPATSDSISWVGRRVPTADGGMLFDWEGVELRFTVDSASIVALNITDVSESGTRLAVYLDMNALPGFRVATLITSPYQSIYTLASGQSIKGETVTYRVVNLIEPQFIRDGASNPLQIDGVWTDGTMKAPPAKPSRRIEFLGDSLTAGALSRSVSGSQRALPTRVRE